MLRILISAYAVSPDMGSEPGMGWNWCAHLARHCELHVITEGEFRESIERVLPTMEQGGRLHFHYLPVAERVRRMCWNQGDWRFYIYYKRWQRRAADVARRLCREQHIDVLHQLNMIGFREPGYLWQVSREMGVPFVWGPIGGMKQFPMAYAAGAPVAMRLFMRLKNAINRWQMKHDRRVDAAVRQASLLIAAIPESREAIRLYKGREAVLIPETGTLAVHSYSQARPLQLAGFARKEASMSMFNVQCSMFNALRVVWVGKFDFRKRIDIALRSVAMANRGGARVQLTVYGGGTQRQEAEARRIAGALGMADSVAWRGNRPHEEVVQAMAAADLLLFTSVSEDTSTVVMEAISQGLPVVCFDTCGMASAVTDEVGVKIPLSNPRQSVRDIAAALIHLSSDRNALRRLSGNCGRRAEQLSYQRKAEQMMQLYLSLRGVI